MSNRNRRKSGNNRRDQAVKSENKAWRDERLRQHNSNLRVPSGTVYKRPSPGKDWK